MSSKIYNVNNEMLYVENVKNCYKLTESEVVDVLESKILSASKISKEQYAKVKQTISKDVNTVATAKDDSTVKNVIVKNVTSAVDLGLSGFSDEDKFDLVEAAYHVYATKRKMGSGRVVSYLLAVAFINNRIIEYAMFKKISKEDLEADMMKIFESPVLSYFKGMLKNFLVSLFAAIVPPLNIIMSVCTIIQAFRFVFMLIDRDAFTYSGPKTESVHADKQGRIKPIHETFIIYKTLNLV